eukprot:3474314-Rhodomonas_salina.1
MRRRRGFAIRFSLVILGLFGFLAATNASVSKKSGCGNSGADPDKVLCAMVRALQNDGARCVQSARSAVLLLQKIGGNEQGELTSLAQRTILLVVVSKSTGEQARWSAAEGFAWGRRSPRLIAMHNQRHARGLGSKGTSKHDANSSACLCLDIQGWKGEMYPTLGLVYLGKLEEQYHGAK